jgi:hypothetical protein
MPSTFAIGAGFIVALAAVAKPKINVALKIIFVCMFAFPRFNAEPRSVQFAGLFCPPVVLKMCRSGAT